MRDIKAEVLDFWFVETQPQQWFQKNELFDTLIRERFLMTYNMAKQGICDNWAQDPSGAVALTVVLDQFPRNMFRNSPQAFETDEKALLNAKAVLAKGFDKLVPLAQRRFLYTPFMHSENLSDQTNSLRLFEAMKADDPMSYDYAVRHYDIIKKYGRFPHRNKILGRDNTEEEDAYLSMPNAGF
jgi:uncharacterized protein (DUF924 family)